MAKLGFSTDTMEKGFISQSIWIQKNQYICSDTYQSGLTEFTTIFMQFKGHILNHLFFGNHLVFVTDNGICNDFTIDKIGFLNIMSISFYEYVLECVYMFKKKKYTFGAKRLPLVGAKRLCAWSFTPQFCQLVPCNKLANIVAMDT